MDLEWYSKFTDKVEKVSPGPSALRDEPAEKLGKERAFDEAEAMEAGEARCTIFTVLQPPVAEQRLVVVRSVEQRVSTLLNAAGETLLMSRAAEDGLRFDIYVSHDGAPPLVARSLFARSAPPEPAPTFTLMASDGERNDWALISLQCERCSSNGKRRCGVRHMMRARHYLEPVGAGQAFCMDVLFPMRIESGARAVFCQSCGCGGSAANGRWSPELTSRRPKWNTKHKSLSLDFRGRATMASAKNFQLESTASPRKPLFLYGKVADNKFVLDYSAPLGMVQAFAAALSVSHWQ